MAKTKTEYKDKHGNPLFIGDYVIAMLNPNVDRTESMYFVHTKKEKTVLCADGVCLDIHQFPKEIIEKHIEKVIFNVANIKIKETG